MMFSRKKRNRILKKILVIFATAAILGLNAVPIANAASLADVNLLKGVDMDATLGNFSGTGPYSLELKLTGTGVLDAKLLNGNSTAVFYAKELTDKWDISGKAHVKSELLPITLEEIPGLQDTLLGLTGTLRKTVVADLGVLNQTVATLDDTLLGYGLSVAGLPALNQASNTLNTLIENDLEAALLDALNKVVVYDEDVTAKMGPNGEVIVDFSDSLGARLEETVKLVVEDVLGDALAGIDAAINALRIESIPVLYSAEAVAPMALLPLPILGDPLTDLLVDSGVSLDQLINSIPLLDDVLGISLGDYLTQPISDLLNDVLSAAKVTLLGDVEGLLGQITDLVLGLLDGVALHALGETVITVPLTVNKPSGLNGDVKVYGELVNTSVIDIALLSSFVDFDTINFNEKAPGTTTPTTPTPTTTTPTKTTTTTTTTGGNKLPNTSTDMWIYGLTGISTLVAGIGTRRFSRRK